MMNFEFLQWVCSPHDVAPPLPSRESGRVIALKLHNTTSKGECNQSN